MNLAYRLGADAVALLHLAYALTIVLGQLLIVIGIPLRWAWIRNLKFRIIHVLMILIVVVESWFGITCPLTSLEKYFREQAGQTSYEGDFIANSIHKLLFFEFTPATFTWIYSCFGALVIGTWCLAPPRVRASTGLKEVHDN